MRSLFCFLLLSTFVAAAGATTTGRGGIFFGNKSLDENDWGQLDSQAAWGIQLDVKDTVWPIWITSGYISSRDTFSVITSLSPFAITDVEGKTSEFHLGVKKDFSPFPIMRLSLAGGPAYIRASLGNSTAPFNNESDAAAGVWAGADVVFFLRYVALGVAYQYSQADVDLFGRSVDAGGRNLSFSIGFGW